MQGSGNLACTLTLRVAFGFYQIYKQAGGRKGKPEYEILNGKEPKPPKNVAFRRSLQHTQRQSIKNVELYEKKMCEMVPHNKN